jgi:hypothetical protein
MWYAVDSLSAIQLLQFDFLLTIAISIRHTLFIFYLEVWNSKRWLVSGDDVPPKERAFIISNHPSEVRVPSRARHDTHATCVS